MQTAITTGKSPTGTWLDDITPNLPDNMPSVFCQGSLLTDKEGTVIDQEYLQHATIKRVLEFGDKHDLTVVAYCNNDVVAKEQNDDTKNLLEIKEMEPRGANPYTRTHACAGPAYGSRNDCPPSPRAVRSRSSIGNRIDLPLFVAHNCAELLADSAQQSRHWGAGRLSATRRLAKSKQDGVLELERSHRGACMFNLHTQLRIKANDRVQLHEASFLSHRACFVEQISATPLCQMLHPSGASNNVS